MKLLFDQNLSFRLCQEIADIFPGSNHVRIIGLDEADDLSIWNYAKTNGFTIVSQDADFAEMAAMLPSPPKVVWLRAGNLPTTMIAIVLRQNAELIAALDHDDAVCLEIY